MASKAATDEESKESQQVNQQNLAGSDENGTLKESSLPIVDMLPIEGGNDPQTNFQKKVIET